MLEKWECWSWKQEILIMRREEVCYTNFEIIFVETKFEIQIQKWNTNKKLSQNKTYAFPRVQFS